MLTPREIRMVIFQRGYTTFELMVVLAIMAIATAMTVPNFMGLKGQRETRKATTELQTSLNLARISAMSRNNTVTATLSQIACPPAVSFCNQYQVDFTDAQGRPIPALIMPGDITMLSTALGAPPTPYPVPTFLLSPATYTITYNSLGLRTSGGTNQQVIAVTHRTGTSYTVVVNPQGKSTWCPGYDQCAP